MAINMSKTEKIMTIDEKLSLTKLTTDKNYEHITVNPEICRECKTFDCVYACPANCYKFSEGEEVDSPIIFDYAPCLECGSCRIVCPHGSVDWHYPKGGFGVEYRNS